MTTSIPIKDAQDIAEKHGYDQIVILARKTGDNGMEHVTTYGVNKYHCEIARKMGLVLKHDIMGWPQVLIDSDQMQSMLTKSVNQGPFDIKTKVQCIELRTYGPRKALLVDWDNGRHQQIELRDGDVDSVISMLNELLALIGLERVRCLI